MSDDTIQFPRRPGLDPGPSFSCTAAKGNGTPDQVRGDEIKEGLS